LRNCGPSVRAPTNKKDRPQNISSVLGLKKALCPDKKRGKDGIWGRGYNGQGSLTKRILLKATGRRAFKQTKTLILARYMARKRGGVNRFPYEILT